MTITKEQFYNAWRVLHNGINVEAELPYYWKLYQKMWKICDTGQEGTVVMDSIGMLLLHIEDMAHLKLGEAFMKEYRIAADVVLKTIKYMNLNKNQSCDVQIEVHLGIKNAPESGMKKHIKDAFFGNDFNTLCDALLWIMHNNMPLVSIFPNSEICIRHLKEEVESILKHDEPRPLNRLAELWLAFNWTDKNGRTIADHVRECFEPEFKSDFEDSYNFDILATEVEKFKVKKIHKDGMACLVAPKEVPDIDPLGFDVILSQPWPKDYRGKQILGMIVNWRDESYLCEPYLWITKDEAANYDSFDFSADTRLDLGLSEIAEKVALSNGEKLSKYEDTAAEGSFTWLGDSMPGLVKGGAHGIGSPEGLDVSWLGDIPYHGDKKGEERECKPVKEPNYSYRPKGKNPEDYFNKKVYEIRPAFRLRDDCERAMDFYEGWLAQAKKYYDASELSFAVTIVRAVLWEATQFYEEKQDECDCKSRIKKIVRESWLLWLEILKKGSREWLENAKINLIDIKTSMYDIFDPPAPFSIDKAMKEIRNIEKQKRD